MGTRLIALDTVAVETFALRAISRISIEVYFETGSRQEWSLPYARDSIGSARLALEDVCGRRRDDYAAH